MKKTPSKPQNPKARALQLLTRRDLTGEELRRRLSRDGFADEEIAEVITWLDELKYLDDQRTAQNWVEQRNRYRPTGTYALQHELKNKGVSDEIISQVVNSPETEYELAMRLAQARLKSMSKVPTEKQYQRIGSLLGRRGFSWDVISKVLHALFQSCLDTDS